MFTIGFARRATAYKRANFIFSDISRLKKIVDHQGPIQLIYGGKAHPHDKPGKEIIEEIFRAKAHLKGYVQIVYLDEYDMDLAAFIVSGVDLWLNTPQKPQEASGTSGMKAAVNGVPSLSVLDGWWIEGHWEGITGWSIGEDWSQESSAESELESLYSKLEKIILPLYYLHPDQYAKVMRSSIALNGSFFSAQRMMIQYAQSAYVHSREEAKKYIIQ